MYAFSLFAIRCSDSHFARAFLPKENPVVLLRVYVNRLLLRRFILNGDAGEDTLEVL